MQTLIKALVNLEYGGDEVKVSLNVSVCSSQHYFLTHSAIMFHSGSTLRMHNSGMNKYNLKWRDSYSSYGWGRQSVKKQDFMLSHGELHCILEFGVFGFSRDLLHDVCNLTWNVMVFFFQASVPSIGTPDMETIIWEGNSHWKCFFACWCRL